MLKRLQEEVKVWRGKNFGEQPSWISLLGAVEELGELAHAHVKEVQGIRMSEDHIENAKDAVGDIVIYLADYCGERGFDFEEVVKKTWEQVKKRNWKENREGG